VPIEINDDSMYLEIDGRIIAVANKQNDGWWQVSHWPRFFDRSQAITALTVTELLHRGHDRNDPVVRAAVTRPGGRRFSEGGARARCDLRADGGHLGGSLGEACPSRARRHPDVAEHGTRLIGRRDDHGGDPC
jgi:hypothetical protein